MIEMCWMNNVRVVWSNIVVMSIVPDKFLKGECWLKDWAGQWDLFICFYSGEDYTTLLKKWLGINFDKCLFIYHDGFVECYLNKRCLDILGREINARVKEDVLWIDRNCKDLKKNTQIFLKYFAEHKNDLVAEETLKKFLQLVSNCFAAYISNKLAFDYLSADILKKKWNVMESARVYSESVYTACIEFVHNWGKQMAKKVKIPKDLFLCCSLNEIETYYRSGRLPSVSELKRRYSFNVILSQNGQSFLLTGSEAKAVEKKIISSFGDSKTIKGTCAYPGKVTGRVRIVFDPKKIKDFKDGDILVTPMTRPEYLSLVKKSAGFITDAGGMLSHAAITARELKKPCVVGTQVATRLLKNGDEVEVDANKGIVNVIKR